MNLSLESIVAPLLSALVSGLMVGVASYVAIRLAVVRLQVEMEQSNARFDRIERQLGISDGNGGAFVRRGEWRSVEESLKEIKVDIHEFRAEVDGRIAILERRVSEQED